MVCTFPESNRWTDSLGADQEAFKVQRALGLQRPPIPHLCDLPNKKWEEVGGPQLVRHQCQIQTPSCIQTRFLAKTYGILSDLLPYETEASVNLSVRFSKTRVGRGNFMTLDQVSVGALCSPGPSLS